VDTIRRAQLVEKIKAIQPEIGRGPGPVVSLQEFFEGNDDIGSIGCNLNASPGPQCFYAVFKAVEERADVQGIFVEIRDLMDDGASWPFADTVFILGKIPQSELKRLLADLQPDEVGPFPAETIPRNLPALQPGMMVLGAWWD
jgi:hypothetical protein